MILDWLGAVLFGVLEPLLDALPTVGLPDLPSLDRMGALIGTWDSFIPLIGPLTIISLWFGALLALFAFRAVLTLWRALPMT